MTALMIIAIVVLGVVGVFNLIGAAIGDSDLRPFCVMNLLVMAFAIITLAIGLGR